MKRVIAFVLVCVMVLTIAPFAFAEGEHPTASQIQITDSLGENHWLSTSKPYYKNDAENPTSEAAGANVAYNETTGVLTLNNYNGGTIRSNGFKDSNLYGYGRLFFTKTALKSLAMRQHSFAFLPRLCKK